MRYRLLTESNAKTVKGERFGYLTGILYLAPNTTSGQANVCPKATQGCIASCLYTAGRGRMQSVQEARINRTTKYVSNRLQFILDLQHDIEQLQDAAASRGLIPAVRLNGTSDLLWEHTVLPWKFSDTQFYDYTKRTNRAVPENYHLTFSRSETNWKDCEKMLGDGTNVAVVFADAIPRKYRGYRVINGDKHDLRFLDPEGVIVGLTAKGSAKQDETGFVVR